jgi:hypothetical protein
MKLENFGERLVVGSTDPTGEARIDWAGRTIKLSGAVQFALDTLNSS